MMHGVGKRYWINPTDMHSFLVGNGNPDLGLQKSVLLDVFPDTGQPASCQGAPFAPVGLSDRLRHGRGQSSDSCALTYALPLSGAS